MSFDILTRAGGKRYHIYVDGVLQDGYYLDDETAVEACMNAIADNPGAEVSYKLEKTVIMNIAAVRAFAQALSGVGPSDEGAPPPFPDVDVTTTTLPDATVGAAYSAQLQATGGDGGYTWSRITGTLPVGMTLSSSGLLSGTPTGTGTANFTVRADDGLGNANSTDDQALTLTVNSASVAIREMNPDNYASLSALLAESYLSDNTSSGSSSSGNAELSLTTGLTGTPWGGTKAVRNNFYITNDEDQPQTGIQINWPPTREVWIEVYYRFSPNWTTYPIAQLGGRSHKSALIYTDAVARWGWAYGGIGDYITAGPEGDDNQYWAANPPLSGSFQDVGGWDGIDNNPDVANALAPDLAWDGQWHLAQHHIKQGAGNGEMQHFEDGVKLIDSQQDLNENSGTGFAYIQLGANRNSGPDEDMWYEIGRVRIYDQEPVGWPS